MPQQSILLIDQISLPQHCDFWLRNSIDNDVYNVHLSQSQPVNQRKKIHPYQKYANS